MFVLDSAYNMICFSFSFVKNKKQPNPERGPLLLVTNWNLLLCKSDAHTCEADFTTDTGGICRGCVIVWRRLPPPIPFRIIHSLLEGTASRPVGFRPLFLLGGRTFGGWQWQTRRLQRGFRN